MSEIIFFYSSPSFILRETAKQDLVEEMFDDLCACRMCTSSSSPEPTMGYLADGFGERQTRARRPPPPPSLEQKTRPGEKGWGEPFLRI